MKKLLLFSLLALAFHSGFAKGGYEIKVTFKHDVPDAYIHLAHYYAKPMPTVYKTDSAKVINKRTAVFKNQDSVLGGIYLVLFEKNSRFFEFILKNGDKMEIMVDTVAMPTNITFKNSPENTRYVRYETELMKFGKQHAAFMEDFKSAKDKKDSMAIQNQLQRIPEELRAYRKNYVTQYPNTFLSEVFKALIGSEPVKEVHYLEDGKTIDSNYAYYYYKDHYWDDFNFNDDRLIYTPLFEGKLNEYFNKLVIPIPDSMNYEADQLLKKTPKGSELFKYSLHWLAKNAENSKVMGMDENFVHLVENYYMKGDAFWLDSEALAKYEERAMKIAPNVLGNIAPDLNLQDIWTLKDQKLSDVQAKYTLIIFWNPSCSHCKTEIPGIDSLYHASLKAKGMKIFSVPTEGELSDIQDFVVKNNIKDWINVVDAQNKSDYRSKYDVYSTPQVFLLDENKKIIGKKLDHTNILGVLEFNERKETGKKGKHE